MLYKTKERERESILMADIFQQDSLLLMLIHTCVSSQVVHGCLYLFPQLYLTGRPLFRHERDKRNDGWTDNNNNKTGRQIGIIAWPIANIFNKSNDFFLLFLCKNNREHSSKERYKWCAHYITVIITRNCCADCKFSPSAAVEGSCHNADDWDALYFKSFCFYIGLS